MLILIVVAALYDMNCDGVDEEIIIGSKSVTIIDGKSGIRKPVIINEYVDKYAFIPDWDGRYSCDRYFLVTVTQPEYSKYKVSLIGNLYGRYEILTSRVVDFELEDIVIKPICTLWDEADASIGEFLVILLVDSLPYLLLFRENRYEFFFLTRDEFLKNAVSYTGKLGALEYFTWEALVPRRHLAYFEITSSGLLKIQTKLGIGYESCSVGTRDRSTKFWEFYYNSSDNDLPFKVKVENKNWIRTKKYHLYFKTNNLKPTFSY